MIIKNITIENFRSYYGENSIDIGNGLTLIIGYIFDYHTNRLSLRYLKIV